MGEGLYLGVTCCKCSQPARWSPEIHVRQSDAVFFVGGLSMCHQHRLTFSVADFQKTTWWGSLLAGHAEVGFGRPMTKDVSIVWQDIAEVQAMADQHPT